MAKSAAREATPGLLRVYPSPDLPPTEYLPGIGIDGADLPLEEAESLVARGLATTTPPASVDVSPALAGDDRPDGDVADAERPAKG